MLEKLIGEVAAHRLNWLEPIGLGFYDCDALREEQGGADVYDQVYFDRYREMADTPMGRALNAFRLSLVKKHGGLSDQITLLDVGIGDGAFLRAVETLPWVRGYGCDVNDAAIAYLEERDQLGAFGTPNAFDVVTFWDSLEHIRDPRPALASAAHVAIVSIPIFTDAADAVTSRHFRPDEHFWYFTRHAFRVFAEQEGFDVVDILATETALGRESIETFVLIRRPS